ncbi:MAG: transposase [Candidatus Syntropharchaeia archaeon]
MRTRFFVKRNLLRDDTKRTLKTVSEGEIRVNTDEYSTYEGIDELEIVKEHRFVNHSKEYAKDDVHVNTAEKIQRCIKTLSAQLHLIL